MKKLALNKAMRDADAREARIKLIKIQVSEAEWDCISAAALDTHLTVREYCRLMVLAASGMGGAAEHIERAIDASLDADFHANHKAKKP